MAKITCARSSRDLGSSSSVEHISQFSTQGDVGKISQFATQEDSSQGSEISQDFGHRLSTVPAPEDQLDTQIYTSSEDATETQVWTTAKITKGLQKLPVPR